MNKQNVPGGFYGNDDPRVKASRTPEVRRKAEETKRRRRENRKALAEDMRAVLTLPISCTDDDIIKIDDFDNYINLSNSDFKDVQTGLLQAIFKAALNGDLKAFELIRDTIGEKAPEVIETKIETKGQSTMAALLKIENELDINNDKEDNCND